MGRVLVWGAGAVGVTVGAHLVRAGHQVTFVDMDAGTVAAIADPARGLAVTGPLDTFRVSASAFVPEALEGTWDTMLLCVKAQASMMACLSLARHLTPEGYVVSLQNGLCERVISAIVGEGRTVGACINFGADVVEPGAVMYGGRGAFVLGELDGTVTPRVQAVHAMVRDSFEPGAVITDEINGFVWGKLATAALMYAQAVGEAGIADCLARPELLPLWRTLAGEVLAVADAAGVQVRGLDGFDPAAFAPRATEDQAQASVAAMVAFHRGSANVYGGVWRDLAVHRRRTEVDVQLLPVVMEGGSYGVETPMCHKLVKMVHEVEESVRVQSDANLVELLAG